MSDCAALVSDLHHLLQGEVTAAPEALAEVAVDFGGMVRRLPRVVVRPADSDDVARTLTYARRNGLCVSTRAKGHSLSGQSLNEGGILIDMRSLDRIGPINTEESWFEADAGVVWWNLAAATLVHGLLPPVLPDAMQTTIGGTHSVGGLGTSSFRYGSQADNCLALEIVTIEGEIIWCSPAEHSELFTHCLCSFGQLGVITRVRHRLRKVPPRASTVLLYYASLERLLSDMSMAAADPRARFVGAWGRILDGRWAYFLRLTTLSGAEGPSELGNLLEPLHYTQKVATGDEPVGEFFLQSAGAGGRLTGGPTAGKPWVDALMPGPCVGVYLREAFDRLPAALLRNSHLLLWPLDGRKLTRPLFMTPAGDYAVLTSVLPSVEGGNLEPHAAIMSSLSALSMAMGGKRYLYGWVEFGLEQWRSHYAERWPELNRLKHKYDPDGMLNRGFIQYELMDMGHPPVLTPPVSASD